MGLEHLQGKRTGRPRGSKSTPRWIRDARWAIENLDSLDAVPPTALARRLHALGHKHPDRLVVCLARLDAVRRQADQGNREGSAAPLNGAGGKSVVHVPNVQAGRLQAVTMAEERLLSYLQAGSRQGWVLPLPYDAHVVDFEVDTSLRKIRFTIESDRFPEVAAGEPIPELREDFTGC